MRMLRAALAAEGGGFVWQRRYGRETGQRAGLHAFQSGREGAWQGEEHRAKSIQ